MTYTPRNLKSLQLSDRYPDFYQVIAMPDSPTVLQKANFYTAHRLLNTENAPEIFIAVFPGYTALIIHKDAPASIELADAILDDLARNPVLDDRDYWQAKTEYAQEAWLGLTVKEREAYCKDVGNHPARASDPVMPRNVMLVNLLNEKPKS